jgi:hypothetical protein
VTVSIRQTLGRKPGGSFDELRWNAVGSYLHAHYLANPAEEARKKRSAERQRFYQCRGDEDMFAMLSQVYKSSEVIELRRQWIEFAKYNNVLRRAVNELATVYSLPARRFVAGADNLANYHEVLRLCRFDEVAQQINRMAVLHRAVAVRPRMRQMPSGEWQPTIDVCIPANFSAVRDPLDATVLVGITTENDYKLSGSINPGPKWSFDGWHESFAVNSMGMPVESTIAEHGLGRLPWILVTLDPPSGCLIDSDTGEDLLAAQKAVQFLSILHLKESKSSTVQTVISGDLSRAALGQVNDSDRTGQLPEGTVMNTVDRGVELSQFLEGARHVGETAGANYGIAPAIMRGDSVASADARELQRLPLRELRLQQHVPFREFERELAALLSLVVRGPRPDLAFETDGWGVDFADPQTPLGTKEALEVFEHRRKLTLVSTVDQKVIENPDIDRAAAKASIQRVIDDEAWRNEAMRPLQQISGSPGAEMPEGTEQNGAAPVNDNAPQGAPAEAGKETDDEQSPPQITPAPQETEGPPAPKTAGPPTAPAAAPEPARELFNGAQMDAMTSTIKDVASGLISRESGIEVLMSGLGMDLAAAQRALGPESFRPRPADAPPPPPASGEAA